MLYMLLFLPCQVSNEFVIPRLTRSVLILRTESWLTSVIFKPVSFKKNIMIIRKFSFFSCYECNLTTLCFQTLISQGVNKSKCHWFFPGCCTCNLLSRTVRHSNDFVVASNFHRISNKFDTDANAQTDR